MSFEDLTLCGCFGSKSPEATHEAKEMGRYMLMGTFLKRRLAIWKVFLSQASHAASS